MIDRFLNRAHQPPRRDLEREAALNAERAQKKADLERLKVSLSIDPEGEFYAVNARVAVLLLERIEELERKLKVVSPD